MSESISEFLKVASTLCIDYPDVKGDLNLEISKVREVSEKLVAAANDFANEPYSTQKRVYMGSHARILLNSVARLMAIADMIDSIAAHLLVESMLKSLGAMKMARTDREFLSLFREYGENLRDLLNQAPKFAHVL